VVRVEPSSPISPPLPLPVPAAPQLPCAQYAAAVCAGPNEPCFLDERCSSAATDPFGGLGCGAGGWERCRFCGFAQYDGIECPLPCTVVADPVCAGPKERCYRDERCAAAGTDPHGGLGCGAGGWERCRFCGFAQYEDVECPQPKLVLDLTVAGTIEEFDPTQFAKYLAVFLFVSRDRIQVEATSASVLVTAVVIMESNDQAAEAQLRLDTLSPTAASDLFNTTVEGKSVRVTSSAAEINSEVISALRKGDEDAGGALYAALGAALILFVCFILIIRRYCKQRALRLDKSKGVAESSTTMQRVSFASRTDSTPSVQDGVGANDKPRNSCGERTTCSTPGEKLRITLSNKNLFRITRRSHRDSHDFSEQPAAQAGLEQPSSRDYGAAFTNRQRSCDNASSAPPQKTRRGTVEAPPRQRCSHRGWAPDDLEPAILPAPHPSVVDRISRRTCTLDQAPDLSKPNAESAGPDHRRLCVSNADGAGPGADAASPVYLALSRLRVPSVEVHSLSREANDVRKRDSARPSCAASDVSEAPAGDGPEAPIHCSLSRWRQIVNPAQVEQSASVSPTITPAAQQSFSSRSPRLSGAAGDVSARHSARLSCAASDVSEAPASDGPEAPMYCSLSHWRQIVNPAQVEQLASVSPTIMSTARKTSTPRLSRRSSACSRSSRRQSSAESLVELWSSTPEPRASQSHSVPAAAACDATDGKEVSCTSSPLNTRSSRSSRRQSSVKSVVELWSSSQEPRASQSQPVPAASACDLSDGEKGSCTASPLNNRFPRSSQRQSSAESVVELWSSSPEPRALVSHSVPSDGGEMSSNTLVSDAPLCGMGGFGPTATPTQSPPILKSSGAAGDQVRVRI